jgi:hypothetical protein
VAWPASSTASTCCWRWRWGCAGATLAGSGIAIYGWTFAACSAGLLVLAVVALSATFIAAWVMGDSGSLPACLLRLAGRTAGGRRTRQEPGGKAGQAVEPGTMSRWRPGMSGGAIT